MKALILDGKAVRETSRWSDVITAYADEKRFWIEIDERTPEAESFVVDVLKIHPLVAEDVWEFRGMPKVADYADYVQLVMHGVRAEDHGKKELPLRLAELDVILGANFLLT